MGFQLILSPALTLQSLATVFVGGVRLATKHLLNSQKYLIMIIDISLRSNTISIFSLFPSAFQVPRPTNGSGVQYLVCLPLVSHGAKYSMSFPKI